MIELLSSAVSVAVVTGVFKLLELWFNRRAIKEDESRRITVENCQARGEELKKLTAKVDALVESEIVTTSERIKHLAEKYIDRGSITVEEFEGLDKMHLAYKRLGGNGFLDDVMNKVRSLLKGTM